MRHRNLFWGTFFLVAAVFIIASQIGAFVQVGIWSIAATVLLAAMLIQSLIHKNFFGVFLSLAFLYSIYWKPLNLVHISLWLLLLAAVLASMGFSFLFHPHAPKCMFSHNKEGQFACVPENIDDNNPYVKVSFGATSKYLHADCLTGGQFIASFSAMEIFFDQVKLSPQGAEIYLDCSFSGVKFYIPKHWQVIDKVNTSLGAVETDVRMVQPAEDAPQLTITGNVQLSGVEIHYI